MKKQWITKLIAAALIVVLIAGLPCRIQAAEFTTWDSLPYADIRDVQKYDLHDITTYREKQTTNTGTIYSTDRYYDNILLPLDSRITYCKKLEVQHGDNISIVAATDDTADQGGTSIAAGQQFYWCFAEYDSEGNIVYDGGWRSVDKDWRVGLTTNGGTGYGLDGYPVGVNQIKRHTDVRYVMPIFRWNNGDEGVGAGEQPITAERLSGAFPVFYLVTKPFTYTFKLNGGSINGSKDDLYVERLGVTTVISPKKPERIGNNFVGWKITSTGGKQAGKIYSQEELEAMLSNGKYYSSLFEDAVIEAQWEVKKPRLVSIGSSSFGVLYNMKLINADPVLRKWYDEVGHLSTKEKCELPLDQVYAKYHISKDGVITQIK